MDTQSLKKTSSDDLSVCDLYIRGLVLEFLNEESRTTQEILDYVRSTARICPFDNLHQMNEFMTTLHYEHKVAIIMGSNLGSKLWIPIKQLQSTPGTPMLKSKSVKSEKQHQPVKLSFVKHRIPDEKDVQREILNTLSHFRKQLDHMDLLEESRHRLQCYLEELEATESNQN